MWLVVWREIILSKPVFRIRIRIDTPDQHGFRPPGSGSGSFHHQAKIVRKTLIPTVLWLLLEFLPLKNDVNVPSKSIKQKTFFKKIIFLLASWRSMTKITGSGSESGSISQRRGFVDPDPNQNVMGQEHCFKLLFFGQVCLVLIPVLYMLLVSLVIRSCIAAGGLQGLTTLLSPDWERLTRPASWLEAACQVWRSERRLTTRRSLSGLWSWILNENGYYIGFRKKDLFVLCFCDIFVC